MRVKDVDFDQGLLVVRSGEGDKDRTTLLADMCRDHLRTQLRAAEAIHRRDRQSDTHVVKDLRSPPRSPLDMLKRGER